jgi:uncharacterized membrane protein YgcG
MSAAHPSRPTSRSRSVLSVSITQRSLRSAFVPALVCAVVACCASTASAQGLSERIKAVGEQKREAARNDTSKARLLGALVYTDVTVQFDKTPAKQAFEYLAAQMGASLVVRYEGEGGAEGIDPEMEVTLALEGVPALTALERMLEYCGGDQPTTWQLRDGFIEAGTKDRLNAPNARELRMYPIRDLLFEPPNFDNAPDFNLSAALAQGGQQQGQGGGQGGGGGGFGGGGGGGFGGGGGGMGGGGAGGGGGIIGEPGEDPERPSEEEQAEKIMDLIKEQCEPEIWISEDIANMRYYQGVLIIRAPDYVHRQIDGYPFAPQRPRRNANSAAGAASGSPSDAAPAGATSSAAGVDRTLTVDRRMVTFTAGLTVVDNVKFTSAPVSGAVGGTGAR